MLRCAVRQYSNQIKHLPQQPPSPMYVCMPAHVTKTADAGGLQHSACGGCSGAAADISCGRHGCASAANSAGVHEADVRPGLLPGSSRLVSTFACVIRRHCCCLEPPSETPCLLSPLPDCATPLPALRRQQSCSCLFMECKLPCCSCIMPDTFLLSRR